MRRTIIACRPLACPAPTIVLIRTFRAPTTSVDPAGLQYWARQTDEKASQEGIRNISSTLGTWKGHPAIFRSFDRDIGSTPSRVHETISAYGGLMFSVGAASPDDANARRIRDEFLSFVEIKFGGLSTPPKPGGS